MHFPRLAIPVGVSVILAAAPAHAQVVRVELRGAPPAEVARELERALSAPVEVRGGAGRTVTISLATASPALTLDRVSALLGGTWRMKLQVRAGQPGAEPGPGPRPSLERSFAIGMQDLPAARAFTLVARELKADLELEGEPEGRITLPAAERPASVLLDRLAEQAGASWGIRYVIEAPDAPAPPEPVERELLIPVPPATRSVSPRPAPSPAARIPVPPSSSAFREALWADVNQLLRADPLRRPEAVREFVAVAEKRIAALSLLTPVERQNRLRAARFILTHWRRMEPGLAPAVRAELAPATQFLEKHLGP